MRFPWRIVRELAVRRPLLRGFPAPQAELSVIASDENGRSTDELVRLALHAAKVALDERVEELERRCRTPDQMRWAARWPGEHYRLLRALVRVTEANRVVEVGTFTGMGAVALASGLGPGGSVITYDIEPWEAFEEPVLSAGEDRIQQRIGDLSVPAFFRSQMDTITSADLIFIDGPKDGRFEADFLRLLLPALADAGAHPLVVFDDIRVIPMVEIWGRLPLPRLDVTSLGHWSGTGIARP